MKMNLGKLLAAGTSIVKANGAIKYHESKQALLPKFISPRNPFATARPPSPETPDASPQGKTARKPDETPPKAPAPAASKSLASWASKLSPASLWGGPAPMPHKVLPAVQAELSLDSVKVVHNDLSDADVEVVPIKSRPAAPESPVLSSAKNSWGMLGKRLLKATAL
jgi:hypothetical protein